jgi:predicted RecA/RadA family phage recombinase
MAITRLTGGLTPADGADPRTFPAVWNGTADDLEAGEYSRVPQGGSAGEVLVKQSATDLRLGMERFGGDYIRGAIGRNAAGGITLTTALNRMYWNLFELKPGFKVKDISFAVVTAGAAGAVLRVGVYTVPNAKNVIPGSLIEELGTVDCTTTGLKTIVPTGSITSTTGYVWVGAAAQGATCVMRSSQNITEGFEVDSLAGYMADFQGTPITESVSGSLPASWTQGWVAGTDVRTFFTPKMAMQVETV